MPGKPLPPSLYFRKQVRKESPSPPIVSMPQTSEDRVGDEVGMGREVVEGENVPSQP